MIKAYQPIQGDDDAPPERRETARPASGDTDPARSERRPGVGTLPRPARLPKAGRHGWRGGLWDQRRGHGALGRGAQTDDREGDPTSRNFVIIAGTGATSVTDAVELTRH